MWPRPLNGINIRENYGGTSDVPRSNRAEMRGPSDISDILSGLKTKTIDIKTKDIVIEDINNNSTISIDDLKSIQTDANVPKRSRRKPKSDKNTVSLDI